MASTLPDPKATPTIEPDLFGVGTSLTKAVDVVKTTASRVFSTVAPTDPVKGEETADKTVKAEKAVKAVKAPKAVKAERAEKAVKADKVKRVPTTIEEWTSYRVEEKHNEEKDRKKGKTIPYQDTTGTYVFTPEGEIKLSDTQTISISPQIRAPPEEIGRFFEQRDERLAVLEEEFAVKKRELQAVVEQYRSGNATANAVAIANGAVMVAEQRLNTEVKLPRKVVMLNGLIERDLYLEKKYEVRVLADPVRQVVYSTFPYKAFWTTAAPVAPEATMGILPAIASALGQEADSTVPTVPRAPRPANIGAIIAARRRAKMAGP